MSVFIQTDLPEPVVPAISIWGSLAMSPTMLLPPISRPTAKESDDLLSAAQKAKQDAEAYADSRRKDAESQASQILEKARNDAKNEISSLAIAIAGKVVGASLDGAHQERLVDSFLEELGEQV